MKREIKFRGKRIKADDPLERWIEGSYIEYTNIRDEKVVRIMSKSGYQNEVNPDTIGQFTGLYDKNEIEIYEGSIIRWRRDGKLYLVKFYAGMFYASVEELNKGVYGGFPLHVLTVSEEDEYKCEVCGNIYDNSELLKGGK